MMNTSDRILKGAELYLMRAVWNIDKKMRNYPEVNYPFKPVRSYFMGAKLSDKNSKIIVYFKEVTYYRTVDGYKQRNNVKYRVLSNIMTKEKDYTVSIESTKSSLDHLKTSFNPEVSSNALTIIASLNNIHYMPIWAQKEFVEYIHDEEKTKISNSLGSKKNQCEFDVSNNEKRKKINLESISKNKRLESELSDKLSNQIVETIDKGFEKKSVFKRIFSFGKINPKRDYLALKEEIEKTQKKYSEASSTVRKLTEENLKLDKDKVVFMNNLFVAENELDYWLKVEEAQYKYDKSNISHPFLESYSFPTVEKEEPKQCKAIIDDTNDNGNPKEYDDSDFVILNDYDFSPIKGLSAIGIYLIEKDKNNFFIGISFDLFKSVQDFILFYKTTNKYPNFLKDFKLKIVCVKSKEEFVDTFKSIKEQYNASFIKF